MNGKKVLIKDGNRFNPKNSVNDEDLDYTKIRRRIEDTLRKTADNKTLLRIAKELSVKID